MYLLCACLFQKHVNLFSTVAVLRLSFLSSPFLLPAGMYSVPIEDLLYNTFLGSAAAAGFLALISGELMVRALSIREFSVHHVFAPCGGDRYLSIDFPSIF
jgi:hypothetical protein